MANVVRAFVEEMLPVWLARRSAQRAAKGKATINRNSNVNSSPTRKAEPYRPKPDFRLRSSHLG